MPHPSLSDPLVVIGGGPAGLTAALYLTRFHLDVLVIDAGHGRAASIPRTRNLPGFPNGISGSRLLARMRRHALRYGARLVEGRVTSLDRGQNGFVVHHEGGRIETAAVLLATGVWNRRPDMPEAAHDRALARGLLRYCPICDAHEVTGKRVAIWGESVSAAREARFVRSYTGDVVLVPPSGSANLSSDVKRELEAENIAWLDCAAPGLTAAGGKVTVSGAATTETFDTAYVALGSDSNNALAVAAGARLSDDGCIVVDAHQRSSVPGLYAAGDIVIGLDQISHAMGQGGVAATAMRNDLAEKGQLVLP